MKLTKKDLNIQRVYKSDVLNARKDYFECFDKYYLFVLKLCDSYKFVNLDTDNLKNVINYVHWEKFKILFHDMIVSRANYERALRTLYNFQIIVLEDSHLDYGFIFDRRK